MPEAMDCLQPEGAQAVARLRRLAMLFLPAALSAGCILSPLKAYDADRLSAGSIVLDVPLVRQADRTTCGLCVADMLAQYYRLPLADADREMMRRRALDESGTPARLLREVLERSGFRVLIFSGESLDGEGPTSIAYHLSRKRPLVVMISPRGRRDHYMVVSGLDAENDMIVFEDPNKGHVMCRGWVFRRGWERSDRFVLLAVPAGPVPDGD